MSINVAEILKFRLKNIWDRGGRPPLNRQILSVIGSLILPVASALLFLGCRPAHSSYTPNPSTDLREITVLFGGDLMQHLPQIAAAREGNSYDFRASFEHLKPIFNSSDLVILNLETTLSDDGNYSGYPLFASPVELVGALKWAGVDALALANNHISDLGAVGLQRTITALEAAGIEHTGAFADSTDYHTNHPLILESNGIKLALLNYTYGTNGIPTPKGAVINRIDTTEIALTLNQIDRRSVDHVVILFHWGDEYSPQPNYDQEQLSKWCRSRGVELVVGSHPHVVQPVHSHSDSTGRMTHLTAYSLGNLVSNQRWRHSDGGILLRITISHRGSEPAMLRAQYIPVWVYTPTINARQRYIVLPPQVADTLLKSGTKARSQYDLFLADTHSLLANDPHVSEYFPSNTPSSPSYLYSTERILPSRAVSPPLHH